eukprot:309447-Prorocentrum_lima.AAC.1
MLHEATLDHLASPLPVVWHRPQDLALGVEELLQGLSCNCPDLEVGHVQGVTQHGHSHLQSIAAGISEGPLSGLSLGGGSAWI